jgi:hypothetical protein
MDYDIIGDIHGHADKLIMLLEKMGYRKKNGAYRHPHRTAVFVGDLIDRGPQQLAVVDIVRRMVDSGAKACLGNHEFNAVAYFLRDMTTHDAYLRPRNAKNKHQHQAFLSEVEHQPAKHKEIVDWFLTLPLWLDMPGFRVVHACWDSASIEKIGPLLLRGNLLDYDLVEESIRKDTVMYKCVETMIKGPEIALPDGFSYVDKDGVDRSRSRIRWWDKTATTYRNAVLMAESEREGLPDILIPNEMLCHYDNKKPLFFGHYWMSAAPSPLTEKIACVDYSAGKGGDLMAYRWNGESTLTDNGFFSSSM